MKLSQVLAPDRAEVALPDLLAAVTVDQLRGAVSQIDGALSTGKASGSRRKPTTSASTCDALRGVPVKCCAPATRQVM